MDARNMEYLPNDCFDVILDKGLFDTFLCSDTNNTDIHTYILEMLRILKSNGKLIIISHGSLESGRIEFVKNTLINSESEWEHEVEHKQICKLDI